MVLQSLDTYDTSLPPKDKCGHRMMEANIGDLGLV